MEDIDLLKVVAKIEKKESSRTSTSLVSHGEGHSYQGVLVKTRAIRFHLQIINPQGKFHYRPFGLGEDVFLDFILKADVSEWTDVADPKLVNRYKELVSRFDEECSRLHPDDVIEITYSKARRLERLKPEIDKEDKDRDFSNYSLVYHPLGFETYTSSYTREGETTPEVVDVTLITANQLRKL